MELHGFDGRVVAQTPECAICQFYDLDENGDCGGCGLPESACTCDYDGNI